MRRARRASRARRPSRRPPTPRGGCRSATLGPARCSRRRGRRRVRRRWSAPLDARSASSRRARCASTPRASRDYEVRRELGALRGQLPRGLPRPVRARRPREGARPGRLRDGALRRGRAPGRRRAPGRARRSRRRGTSRPRPARGARTSRGSSRPRCSTSTRGASRSTSCEPLGPTRTRVRFLHATSRDAALRGPRRRRATSHRVELRGRGRRRGGAARACARASRGPAATRRAHERGVHHFHRCSRGTSLTPDGRGIRARRPLPDRFSPEHRSHGRSSRSATSSPTAPDRP